jgi:hypothetical protein
MLVTYRAMASAGLVGVLKRRKIVEASRRTWEVAYVRILALAVGMLALMVVARWPRPRRGCAAAR